MFVRGHLLRAAQQAMPPRDRNKRTSYSHCQMLPPSHVTNVFCFVTIKLDVNNETIGTRQIIYAGS